MEVRMSANFDDNISVTVVADAAPVGRAGFGTPLIADAASMTERIRFYTSASAAAADATAGQITAAQSAGIALAFSQASKPRRVAAGRIGVETAQVSTLTVAGSPTSGVYSFLVGAILVTTTAVVPTATNNDIATALRAAATTALSASGITVSGATALIVLTGTVGVPFAVSAVTAPTPGTLAAATLAAVTIGGELDAIVAENGDWYGLTLVSRVKAVLLRAAAWTESGGARIFAAQSSDADILTTANTDLAYALQQLSYSRTFLTYYPTDATAMDLAWMSNRLSADLDVQQIAWYYATLAGVTPTAGLTATQKANVTGKNANLYLTLSGNGATGNGFMASGRDIDEQTTVDWLVARTREAITQLFLSESNALRKIPFTEDGFEQISSVVYPVLRRGLRAQHFALAANGAGPFVDMPTLAEVSSGDRAARLLRFSFGALLAGGVRSVIASGSVTTDNGLFEALAASVEV
jgi:hypothetical protein